MTIGIIPSAMKTFEIDGDFNSSNLQEGKLYYDTKDNRLYYYDTKETRSNPSNGYFPIWNGKKKLLTQYSIEKYFPKDVIKTDLSSMSSSISKDVADQVIYMQRRCDNDEILKPPLSDKDNWFTQCIKGSISAKELTMIDLVDMCKPELDQKVIENYYSALMKIPFMRIDKWNVWIDIIMHLGYRIDVSKEGKHLLSYDYRSNKFNTGIVKYDNIIKSKDDSLKKIIKILMIMENITKSNLRSDDVDDYTINNMMTTINGSKPLSAQLFSRFLRMAGLSYKIQMIDNDKIIFEYSE